MMDTMKSFWNHLWGSITRLHRDERGELGVSAQGEGQVDEPSGAPEGQPDSGEGVLVPDLQSVVQDVIDDDSLAEPGPEPGSQPEPQPEPAPSESGSEPAAYNPLDHYSNDRFSNVRSPEEHVRALGQSYDNLERLFHDRDEETGRLRAAAAELEQLKAAKAAGQPDQDVEGQEEWSNEEVADLLQTDPMQVFNDFGTQIEARLKKTLDDGFERVGTRLNTVEQQPAAIQSQLAWNALCQKYPDAPKHSDQMIATREEVGKCSFEDHLRYLTEIKNVKGVDSGFSSLVAELLAVTDGAGNHKFSFERARDIAESDRARATPPPPVSGSNPPSVSPTPRGSGAVPNITTSDIHQAVEEATGT